MEVIDELCSVGGRFAGTDAERRAANSVAERLRKQGRRVDVESTYVHPQLGLILALHCAVGLAGSLIGVGVPEVGFALVLVAATSLYLDLNSRFYLLRRLFFRRVSQNIVARNPATASADQRLLVCAHVDTAKTGLIYKPGRMDRFVRLFRFLGIEVTPPRLIFWSLAVLVPILGARAAGLDNDGIALLQLLPTLVLLLACFALIELELSPVVPGANDDASGVATALSLADELDHKRPRNLDVWVVITGGEECLFEGMRSFLRRHSDDLKPPSTWVVNIDAVGGGDVRYATAEGLAISFDFRSRLTEVCDAIADSDREDGENRYRASALKHGFATDAIAARLRKLKTTTITCIEPKAVAPANYHLPSDVPAAIDPKALQRAHDFTLAVIRALDADLGRKRD
jgi:hypothetical protein